MRRLDTQKSFTHRVDMHEESLENCPFYRLIKAIIDQHKTQPEPPKKPPESVWQSVDSSPPEKGGWYMCKFRHKCGLESIVKAFYLDHEKVFVKDPFEPMKSSLPLLVHFWKRIDS